MFGVRFALLQLTVLLREWISSNPNLVPEDEELGEVDLIIWIVAFNLMVVFWTKHPTKKHIQKA